MAVGILEARSTRKEGLLPKPQSLNYVLPSQWKKYHLLMLEALTCVVNIQDTGTSDFSRECFEPEQIKMVPEQIQASESYFASCDVFVSLPAGFGKI